MNVNFIVGGNVPESRKSNLAALQLAAKYDIVLLAADRKQACIQITAWTKASIEQIEQAGLMNGVASKRFAPNEHATRAKASRDQEDGSAAFIN